jgi:hypothetical protein
MIKSRRIRWAKNIKCMGEKRTAYRSLMGKPERNRALGRSKRGWEDNIEMDLREGRWGCKDWIHLAQEMQHW